MRLISQDGMIDVPYEQVSLEVNENEIYCGYSSILTRHCTGRRFAEYSSKEKALKVMEMLRKAYVGLPIIMQNVEVEDEVIEKLKVNNVVLANIPNEKSNIEYINNGYFKFPKDEEVEV